MSAMVGSRQPQFGSDCLASFQSAKEDMAKRAASSSVTNSVCEEFTHDIGESSDNLSVPQEVSERSYGNPNVSPDADTSGVPTTPSMESETDNGSVSSEARDSEMSSGADRNTDEFDDRDRAADYDDC